jgi:CII-binding regulator of phage lambda lysogenization HflD
LVRDSCGIRLNLTCRLLSLEKKIKTAAMYKPGLQACFLVDKMAESEKSIQEVLVRWSAHLEVIERKVDSTAADLRKVQDKVDLAMTSLSRVQDEHA